MDTITIIDTETGEEETMEVVPVTSIAELEAHFAAILASSNDEAE